MSSFYLDSSAWLKRYAHEPGSAWVHNLFDRDEYIASSTLGYVEVIAALSRRLPPVDFTHVEPRLESDWQSMSSLPLTATVMERAADVARKYRLRGADAVHLAAALDFQKEFAAIDRVVFVASDTELLKGAQAAGLPVENPLRPANQP